MELVRTTAKDVQILGYEGEPYIRLGTDGVFVNTNSPAYYTNLDRFSRNADSGDGHTDGDTELGQAQRRQLGPLARPSHPLDGPDAAAGRARQPRRRACDLSGEPRRT